jgi:starvation-inducible outer membrane lipoprotein
MAALGYWWGAYPLNWVGKPIHYKSRPQGVFVAQSSSGLDEHTYRLWRLVTVAGTLLGNDTGPGGMGFPVVDIKEIHLREN